MKNALKWFYLNSGGVAYSSEFQAILDNATSRGYTQTNYKAQTDAFISGMVSDGDWAEADIGYIFATDQADFSRINIKSPSNYLATVGGTGAAHTDKEGWTSGGGGWLDTGWNLSTNSVKYTQDSASIHIGITVAPSTAVQTLAGVRNTGTNNGLRVNNSSTTQLSMQINSTATSVITRNYSNKLYSLYRNAASGANSVQLFEDGVNIGSTNITSSALESLTLSILALNNGGSRLGFTNAKIGFVLVGSKNINSVNLTSRWNTFKSAIA